MKYPPKSITFRSRVIGLRVAKMSSQRHALAKKIFWKYQQISANFSNCDGVYFQKRIISTTGECALKKNSATIFFVYYNINQFKNLKMSRPWKQLPIHWSGEIFPFHLVFPNEGCSCAAQLHHIKKWSVEFVHKLLNMSGKYIIVSTGVIKNISFWPISGARPDIFLLDISKSGKNQLRG